jgi:hypothetical protein
MPDASLPPWAQSEKDREKRRLKVVLGLAVMIATTASVSYCKAIKNALVTICLMHPPPSSLFLQDLEHRRRVDPSNDIGRALALKAAAAKVSGAAAMGMSAGASGGEAVAVAKGEDKAAMLQRLRQQV